MGEAIGFGLDEFGSGTLFCFSPFLVLFGGFGAEERGGEGGDKGVKV